MGPGINFFFSSRRRHTRCGRDWSSDVCSSDLLCSSSGYGAGVDSPGWYEHRSEERRVGKEGRSRWLPYHLKKRKISCCGQVYRSVEDTTFLHRSRTRRAEDFEQEHSQCHKLIL